MTSLNLMPATQLKKVGTRGTKIIKNSKELGNFLVYGTEYYSKTQRSRRISGCKGQGRKPLLAGRELQAIRWHCNKKQTSFCSRNHCMGSGTRLKTAVCEHCSLLHSQMQLNSTMQRINHVSNFLTSISLLAFIAVCCGLAVWCYTSPVGLCWTLDWLAFLW